MINNIEYKSWSDYMSSEEAKEYNEALERAQKKYDSISQELYESLEYDQKMQLVYHVTRMIYENEFNDNGSYRHLIYDKLGFSTDAYANFMDSGLMYLHNSVFTHEDIVEGLNKIFKFLNVEANPEMIGKAYHLFIGGSFENIKIDEE